RDFHVTGVQTCALPIYAEPAHPVRLGPENRLERVGRDDLEVVREVEAGGAVQDPPVLLDELDELEPLQVFGPQEHEVLEQVCEEIGRASCRERVWRTQR